jgi:hypothetical protein
MSKISETHRTPRRGRVFPELSYSPEELAQRKAEREALMQRCYDIFNRVQPELIKDYYDWYMAIEPESGDYFIDEDEKVAAQKAHEKYPDTRCVILCINETGACYRV